MQDPTIKQAQEELAQIKGQFEEILTAYERKYNVEIGYTIFADHAKDGAVQIRINANL